MPLQKCRMQAEFSATQLLVALRAYEADHGEIAPSLEILVPNYLPAVPVDDFDGQPLRCEPQERLVYSVGENLVDNGADREKDFVWAMGYPDRLRGSATAAEPLSSN